MFYDFGTGLHTQQAIQNAQEKMRQTAQTKRDQYTTNSAVKEMEQKLARLSLLNQALWELVRDRLELTDADLEMMARQVDLRDGVEDGRITEHAVRCPQCQRVCNSRHARCIYCGQEFSKMPFA